MKSKKASALLITLTAVVAIAFLSSIGFLIFGGDGDVPDEEAEEKSLQEQLALQAALLEMQQEEEQTAVPSASFGGDVSDSDDDDDAPNEIENLHLEARGDTWIHWDWDNPDDDDFDKNLIYIDGTKVSTTSSSYYNATGLSPGVSYTIEVKTRDFDGNVNDDGVEDTVTTLGSGSNDTGISATSISNLKVDDRGLDYIHWKWSNPTGAGFTMSYIVVDGVNVLNTTNTYYHLNNLNENTLHTISITTNLNSTSVTKTTSTCYLVEWFEEYTVCP